MSFSSKFGGFPLAPANPSYEAINTAVNVALVWPTETTEGNP